MPTVYQSRLRVTPQNWDTVSVRIRPTEYQSRITQDWDTVSVHIRPTVYQPRIRVTQ